MSPVVARCGDGKLSGDGGAEYPCVSRFRYRRLIAFLWLYGFEATAESYDPSPFAARRPFPCFASPRLASPLLSLA
jgi:hypothetical protein